MDKKLLIDSYLEGKHPIGQETWELPSEGELDRDEALYDALLAENGTTSKASPLPAAKERQTGPAARRSPLLWRGRGRLMWLSAAAVLIAVVGLFTWRSITSEPQTQLAETTTEPVVGEVPKSEPPITQTSPSTQITQNTPITQNNQRTPSPQNTQITPITPTPQALSAPEPKLLDAADSLYYYLTQLENQMGDCRDSTCLAELTGLMRADERIKDLVNKIIHKQVETAYQEEYLVDTTTRYIPL